MEQTATVIPTPVNSKGRLVLASVGWLILHVLLVVALTFNQLPGSSEVIYQIMRVALIGIGIGGVWAIQTRFRPQQLDTLTFPILLLARLQSIRKSPLFMIGAFIVAALMLIALWVQPMPFALLPLQKEIFRAYGTAVILAVTYVTMFWRADTIQRVGFRQWVFVCAVMGFAVLMIALHYLDRFPRLNQIDELHNWQAQWTFARTGLLGESMYRQMIPLPQPILDSPHYMMGLLLRFIGDSFWQSRFARLLLNCLALPFIYLAGAKLYGKRVGVFAVAIAALLIPPTSFVRPDVFVGVMLSLAIYLYWRAQTTRRPWMHFLTGLCVALAGEGHPLAYRFGLAFGLIYGMRWLHEMWQRRKIFIDGRIIALGVGGVLGIFIYLSIHIFPNPVQGLHFASNYSPHPTDLISRLQKAFEIIEQQASVWLYYSPFEVLLITAGAVLAFRQNKHADRLLLTLLLLPEVILMLTYAYYRQFYQAHYLPIFALLGGRFLASLTDWFTQGNTLQTELRQSQGKLSTLFLASLLLVTAVAVMLDNAQVAAVDPQRDEFTEIARQLKADLPADAVVVGNENYFLEIRSMNYYGVQTVTTPNWYLVDYSGYKLWEVTKPDIFILSGKMDAHKYTDLISINEYMHDKGFSYARCYTVTGLVEANVYVRKMPPGWKLGDRSCFIDNKINSGD